MFELSSHFEVAPFINFSKLYCLQVGFYEERRKTEQKNNESFGI